MTGWRRYCRPIWPNWRADVDDELRFHLDMTVERLVAKGWPVAAARAEAERRFGAVGPVREACMAIDRRRGRRAALADRTTSFTQDLRFGVRMLRRNPGFSLLALLCLTLAIGANAAVYSWIEGILLRPYPLVVQQDRLFALAGTERGTSGYTGTSWPDLVDLQRGSALVASFIVNNITGTTLSVGERAQVFPGGIVSANYFDAIGVRPLLGRGVCVGVIVAMGGTRLLGDLLYQVSPRDPAMFGSALLVIAQAAAAACLIPAWRATRIDPVRALRLE